MAEVDVQTSIVIDRPREVVSEYAGNPVNVMHWYVNIKSVEWKTTPPAVIGSQIAFVTHFLGKRLAYTYEVVEQEINERLVMRTSQGPFPIETSYTWEALTSFSTRMTLRNRGKPTGISALMAPVMSWMIRRENTKDLVLLKKILEKSAG